MKYKVTFYNDLVELLTERKANFVHKLKGLTTKIINELMNEISQKYNFRGTTGDKLVQLLLRVSKYKPIGIEEVVFLNIPINGKNVAVVFEFICADNRLKEFDLEVTGKCGFTRSFLGERTLQRISIDVYFTINDETAKNTKQIQSRLINEIQQKLVHELAHAHDEYLEDEAKNYKSIKSSDEDLTNEDLEFLNYWLTPTEIRSHLNEVFQSLASMRHVSPKRVIKNFYKNDDKAASREEDPIPFTQDKKDKLRKGYANMVNLDNSRPSYDLAIKVLDEIISKAFKPNLPKSQRQFIIDYHIAFARDFNPKMKERYFDKLFQGYEVPSLEQMNSMFEEVKSVFKETVRIYNALKKKYYYEDKLEKIKNMFKEWENVMWDNPKMTAAMKSNDPKKLKKAAKYTFDLFKAEMGIDKDTLAKDEERRRQILGGR